MSTTSGNIDTYIEVALKLNEDSGKVIDVAVKTVNGELINFDDFKDPDWWLKRGVDLGDFYIRYKLEGTTTQLNYSNLSNFITSEEGTADLIEGLERVAASNKDYSKWIKNYNTLFDGANDLVSLSEEAMKISDAIEKLNSESGAERGRAIADIAEGIFSMGSNLSGKLPGITGDLITAELKAAVDALENGADILIKYIKRLEKLESDIEAITGENKQTVEGMEAINEIAELFSPIMNGGAASVDGLKEYYDLLVRYNKAVYEYEKKYGIDIDGDGDICDGDPYDPQNPGDGSGGGGSADDQFNNGENQRVDPIVFDLNNDGFNPTNLSNGANFDLDCNGMAERINWVQGDDALLAFDKNEDGIINDGEELFGDNTTLMNGEKALNGFQALSEFDTNEDGIITSADDNFDKLLIWKDENGDAISDINELLSLNDIGIRAIYLDYTNLNSNTESGAVLGNVCKFVYADGNESRIAEYWVISQKFNTVDINPIEIPEEIAALPNVNGMGNAYSLHKAMTLDTTGRLVELVKEFSVSDDPSTRRGIIDQILLFITNAEEVSPGSRGPYIDAQKLTALECLLGQTFLGQNGENPNSAAAPLLNSAYNTIADMYYCELIARTSIKDEIKYIKVIEVDGIQSLDLSIFNQCIRYNVLYDENGKSKLADAASYLKYLQTYYYSSCFDDFKEYFETNCSNSYVKTINIAAGIAILGTTGNDSLRGTNDQYIIYADDGNDSLYGSAVNDTIYGGNGNDLLRGGAGEDYLYGEKGNDDLEGGNDDDILEGGRGDDILDGGKGNDVLEDSAGNDIYVFAKGYGNDIIIDACGLNTIHFKGLNPTDILVNGTGEYDATITIKGTNDTLVIKDFRKGEEYANYDLEFDDVKMHVTDKGSPFKHIFGGNGDDVLKAVVDDSIMHAFGGNDTVYGSDGNDMIYSNKGDDVIYAGSGNDFVHGGNDGDIIDGGESNDLLYGGSGNDTYIFGRNYGTDIISDSEGVSTIKTADGIALDELDIISVGEDIVIAIKDSEDKLIINGFAENPDNYLLDVGDVSILIKDCITAENSEFLSGSDESEYIVNENSSVVAGGSGDDRIIGIEGNEIIFSDSGNDQILANVGSDVVFGGSGDDYINGGDENDIIDGGSGNDFIDGGVGDDTYFFNPGYGNDSIRDSDGVNTIMFGDGFTATGIKAYRSNWNDLLITFDGFDDTLTIKNYCIDRNARNFTLVFADGTVVEAAAQDSPLRKIYGTDGSEYMESIYDDGIINDAQASNDQIVGSDGNDMLYGGDGDERLTGKQGDDVLDGGKGNDYISGGAGNDTYIFNKGYGVDTISDGEGTNTINIYGYTASQIKAYRTNWNDITITFADSEDKIVIEGFFTSEANRNFYLTFNGGGRIHATASNSPLRTIYGTDGDDYMAAMDDRGVTLYGESGTDNLNGGSGADKLYGGIGNDQLYGNGGNDNIDGGEGDDMLYGGTGNDAYIFNAGSGTDTIIDSEGINTILFGAGLTEDTMTAYRHNWNDLMIAFKGVEDKLIIQGYFSSESNRNFEVRFADGTRYAYDDAENPIKQVHATEYDDWMTAWSDNGIALHGDGGNDNLTGGEGDDMLFGGIGNDTLNGNDDDDILDGGEDNDFLYGGLGNDTYRFGIGYASDIIEDNDGDNKVELLSINFDAVSFEMTDSGELVITITESGDVLTIRNFDSERFAFEFADKVSGTFNVATGEFERILSEAELAALDAANTEDALAQANAEILDELYADDNSISELFTENDTTVISEITDSESESDENKNTTDQIDVQVMILTENMAAFSSESNISDNVNMENLTDNYMFASQLLIDTQAS